MDAYSHPISCGDGDFQLDKQNELDGEVHYLMSRVRNEGDSSETETDSETEMTVIKPKLNRKMRLGSNQSYGKVLGVISLTERNFLYEYYKYYVI